MDTWDFGGALCIVQFVSLKCLRPYPIIFQYFYPSKNIVISLRHCSLFVVSPLVATFALVSLLPSIKLSKAFSKLFHAQVTLKWNADPGPHLMPTPQFLSSSILYSHQWIFSPSTFVVSSGDEISGWRGVEGGGCWGTHPFPGPGQWTSASPTTS